MCLSTVSAYHSPEYFIFGALHSVLHLPWLPSHPRPFVHAVLLLRHLAQPWLPSGFYCYLTPTDAIPCHLILNEVYLVIVHHCAKFVSFLVSLLISIFICLRISALPILLACKPPHVLL